MRFIDISEQHNNLKTRINLSTYAFKVVSKHKLFRVHSIFKSGFNLITPEGLILYCTNQIVGKNVMVLEFETDVFLDIVSQIRIDDIVKISNDIIIFYSKKVMKYMVNYDLTYDSEGISYLSRTSLIHFYERYAKQLKELEKELIENSGFFGSKFQHIQVIEFPRKNKLTFAELSQLNGKGTGLTPTGEDFLIGYSIFNKALRNNSIDHFLSECLREGEASEISISSYKVLIDNQFDEVWQDIIDAIVRNEFSQFYRYICEATQKGATSGYDQVLGFLHSILYMEENYG